jgi:hypothetical protein
VTLVLPRQRRRAAALLAKAGVTPNELRVRAGDAALAEVTGAREPSGVPVRVHVGESVNKRSASGGRPSRRPSGERFGERSGERSGDRFGDRRPPRHR